MHYVHYVSSHLPPLDAADASDTIDTAKSLIPIFVHITQKPSFGKSYIQYLKFFTKVCADHTKALILANPTVAEI